MQREAVFVPELLEIELRVALHEGDCETCVMMCDDVSDSAHNEGQLKRLLNWDQELLLKFIIIVYNFIYLLIKSYTYK